MAADTITLPRDELFEAAAWLFAFDELFTATEEESPAVLEQDDVDDWKSVAHGLANQLADGRLPGLDDDAYNTDPLLVALFARAREHAVSMLRLAESEARKGRYPFTDGGSPWTPKGLHALGLLLRDDARTSRELGVIYQPVEVPDA